MSDVVERIKEYQAECANQTLGTYCVNAQTLLQEAVAEIQTLRGRISDMQETTTLCEGKLEQIHRISKQEPK